MTWQIRRRWLPHADGRGVRARFRRASSRRAGKRRDAEREAALRRDRGESSKGRWYDHIDGGGCLDIPTDGVGVAIVVGIVVIVLILFFGGPVLLLGIDLLWFVVVFVAGAIGRFVFGRPWSVEAIDEAGERRVWKVRGFADAGRLRDQLDAEFGAGLDPRPDRGAQDDAPRGR